MTICVVDAGRDSGRMISKMSIFSWLMVAIGISLFFIIGFLPEIKKWHHRKKNTRGEDGESIEVQDKVTLSIFGIALKKRR